MDQIFDPVWVFFKVILIFIVFFMLCFKPPAFGLSQSWTQSSRFP